MENKTVSQLNEKAWYRLLKVVFIILFLIVLVIFNVIVFSNGIRQINYKKTLITCKITQSENKKISLSDVGVYFSPQELANFNYGKFFKNNNYDIQTILGACNKGTILNFEGTQIKSNGVVGEDDVYRWQAMADEKLANGKSLLDEFPFETWRKWDKNNWNNYINYKARLFDIAPVFTYRGFLEFFFIGNFIILLIFEATRRTFYYIVLGNLRPKK